MAPSIGRMELPIGEGALCDNKFLSSVDDLHVDIANAYLRDLHYTSENLYPNCIIRHILRKWTDHSLGI